MASNTAFSSQEQETDWGRLALIGVAVGMGLALLLSLVWLGIMWFNGTHPPGVKPWTRAAIVAKRSTIASSVKGGETVEVTYVLENRTNEDYRIEYDAPLLILLRNKDDVLSQADLGGVLRIEKPILVAARQKALLKLSLPVGPAERHPNSASETDRGRGFLENRFPGVSSFAVFDGAARYEIDLPVPRLAEL